MEAFSSLDPAVIERVVDALVAGPTPVDYASNVSVRTYPRGLGAQAFWIDTLHRMDRLAQRAHLREHVTALVHEQPAWFATASVEGATDASDLRLTVDTPDDLELVRSIHARLAPAPTTPHAAIVALLRAKPSLSAINAAVEQRSWRHVDPRPEALGGAVRAAGVWGAEMGLRLVLVLLLAALVAAVAVSGGLRAASPDAEVPPGHDAGTHWYRRGEVSGTSLQVVPVAQLPGQKPPQPSAAPHATFCHTGDLDPARALLAGTARAGAAQWHLRRHHRTRPARLGRPAGCVPPREHLRRLCGPSTPATAAVPTATCPAWRCARCWRGWAMRS